MPARSNVAKGRLVIAAARRGVFVLALTAMAATPGWAMPASPRVPAPAPWEHAGALQSIQRADGSTDPAVRGAWRSRGYGWVLAIDVASVVRYQQGDVCYAAPVGEGPLSEMASASYRYFRLLPGGQSAIFQLLDGDTNVVFDRLPSLPQGCTDRPDASPAAVAAAFLDHFERHYAFFDLRPPGFAARAERMKAAITPGLDDDALWQAFGRFMEGLSDSHTKLIRRTERGTERIQDGQGTTLPRIRETLGESQWLTGLIDATRRNLGDSARQAGGGRILWGTIDGRVGYLQLFVMGGFTDRSDFASAAWAEAEMAALNTALDEAFASFQGLDAVIVDLSNNRGGWDRVAKALPGRFTNHAYVGFTTQTWGSGLAPFPNKIEPAKGPRFVGPVYLMTSDVTVSGGELATLAFRGLDQVVQVGSTTRGAFSTPLAKPLPNGWLLELSNEVFAAPDGTVFEERGLAPDIELAIYPADDPVGGHWLAVRAVADRAIAAADQH